VIEYLPNISLGSIPSTKKEEKKNEKEIKKKVIWVLTELKWDYIPTFIVN
jgi:hypothetical protein